MWSAGGVAACMVGYFLVQYLLPTQSIGIGESIGSAMGSVANSAVSAASSIGNLISNGASYMLQALFGMGALYSGVHLGLNLSGTPTNVLPNLQEGLIGLMKPRNLLRIEKEAGKVTKPLDIKRKISRNEAILAMLKQSYRLDRQIAEQRVKLMNLDGPSDKYYLPIEETKQLEGPKLALPPKPTLNKEDFEDSEESDSCESEEESEVPFSRTRPDPTRSY